MLGTEAGIAGAREAMALLACARRAARLVTTPSRACYASLSPRETQSLPRGHFPSIPLSQFNSASSPVLVAKKTRRTSHLRINLSFASRVQSASCFDLPQHSQRARQICARRHTHKAHKSSTSARITWHAVNNSLGTFAAMSTGKLDQSLDEIMKDSKSTRGRGRGGRRSTAPRRAATVAKAKIAAPAGGIAKSTKTSRAPKAAIPAAALATGDSKIIVSGLVRLRATFAQSGADMYLARGCRRDPDQGMLTGPQGRKTLSTDVLPSCLSSRTVLVTLPESQDFIHLEH